MNNKKKNGKSSTDDHIDPWLKMKMQRTRRRAGENRMGKLKRFYMSFIFTSLFLNQL